MRKQAGGNTRKFYHTGLSAATTFEVEVSGINGATLEQARSQYLAAAGPRCPTRSRSLSLLILQDPLWKAALGPAIMWHRLAWDASTRPLTAVASLQQLRLWGESLLARAVKT